MIRICGVLRHYWKKRLYRRFQKSHQHRGNRQFSACVAHKRVAQSLGSDRFGRAQRLGVRGRPARRSQPRRFSLSVVHGVSTGK